MRSLPSSLSIDSLNFDMLSPISWAYLSRLGRSRFCCPANSLSCISQNFPWVRAASAASAAGMALLWNGSGLCR